MADYVEETDAAATTAGGSDWQRLIEQVLKSQGLAGGVPSPVAEVGRVRRRAESGDAPLSFAQQRLWLLEQLQAGTSAYHVPMVLRLHGRLDPAALERALGRVVERHEALRTRFPAEDGEPRQEVLAGWRPSIETVDLTALAEAERGAEWWRRVGEAMHTPFDLAAAPPMRALLLRLSDEEAVFSLVMHHIITDGWSVGVLRRELSALYEEEAGGARAELPELPVQYADYADWQRDRLEGGELTRQLEYWRGRLAGAPAVLELPADRQRPAAQSLRGASVRASVAPEVVEELKALGRREGASLFMVLLAAFKALLWRQTGESDLVVGTPVAGRARAELEGLIGFFVNTLVLRTDLSAGPTFVEALQRVRDTFLDAYQHQEVPFERVVEELRPERSLAHAPLCQVYFNMLNFPESEFKLAGLRAQFVPYLETEAKFDLTVYAAERKTGLSLVLVYNRDLFDEARVALLAEQYAHLLGQLAKEPGRKLAEYPLVTPGAASVLPDSTARQEASWGGAVHELFSRQAARAPQHPAVRSEREAWSYQQLEERSNQLAHALVAEGVRPGETVAVYAHRSPTLVWAVLGVLKAGAAFVILDPAYPATRSAHYLRAARVRGWLQLEAAGPLSAPIEECLEELGCRPHFTLRPEGIFRDGELLRGVPVGPPSIVVGPDDLAYVAFTSGSTGQPKGVLGRHQSLGLFTGWAAPKFGIGAADRFSLLSGLSHDPLHRDIFTPLQLGALLCVPDQEEIETPGRLAQWMCEQGVTVTNLTPALGQLLTLEAGDAPAEPITSLRYAFYVGDVLTWRDVSQLRGAAPGVTCVNLYGATETQRAVSYYVVPEEEAEPAGEKAAEEAATDGLVRKEVLPVGRGIAQVQLLVLNPAGLLAGVGELGEVCFRSPHLAAGYAGDAQLTREKFITNPLTGEPGDRLYRTGDLGRYRPDGDVELAGRADQQVKIRGYRVEPAEIEAALAGHERVRDCVVIGRENGAGEKSLVAYVVGADDEPPTTAELREHLRGKLPEYMIPAHFVPLERLPLTPNGKLDRGALPAPAAGGDTEALPVAPRNPIEEVIVGVLARLLKVERVGVNDNFFELGGHSLLAMQVVAHVRRAFQVDVPLRNLFESPTAAGLARSIEAAKLHPPALEAPALRRAPREGNPPLSFNQEARLFREWRQALQSVPRKPFHNRPAYRLLGPLNTEALERALGEVVRRHEALRATFIERRGLGSTKWLSPVLNRAFALKGVVKRLRGFAKKSFVQSALYQQVVVADAPVRIRLVDLTGVEAERREAEFQRQAAEESARLFDYTRAPLLRATLYKFGDGEHILFLVIHHFISDGWSLGIIMRELASLYTAYATGRPSPLAEPPLQFRDFAEWQREWLRGEALDSYVNYWKGHLAKVGLIPALRLPFAKPRQAKPSHRGARHTLLLPAALQRSLVDLSRREGVTMHMLMLAAVNTLLHRHTGVENIGVFTAYANRTRSETHPLVGWVANFHVLATDLEGDPPFAELLVRVREAVLGAYAHQEVPVSLLFVSLLEHFEDKLPKKLFEVPTVSFSFVDRVKASPRLHDLAVQPVNVRFNAADPSSLSFTFIELQETLKVEIGYAADNFDAADIERLARHLQELLEGVVARPKARLSELSLSGAA